MSEIIPETFKIAASGFFPDCLDHLADAIRSVHEHINEAAACDQTRGMAATLALAWFTPENLYLANVGDSRIYLSRDGNLEQLSRDHTAAWGQWKRGEIPEIQYRTHPRRSALYEVIGGGHRSVCPHFAAVPYQPGDRFLICSDGLIDGRLGTPHRQRPRRPRCSRRNHRANSSNAPSTTPESTIQRSSSSTSRAGDRILTDQNLKIPRLWHE